MLATRTKIVGNAKRTFKLRNIVQIYPLNANI